VASKAVEAMNAAKAAKGAIGGRPTKYKRTYVTQAKKLCRLGATDYEIANFFGVSVSTLFLWKAMHKDFSEALVIGKEEANTRVERSLYSKATGYTYDSEKVFQFQGEIIRAAVVEHVPPSESAAMLWLKNRKKDEWRDTQDFTSDGEKLEVSFVNGVPRPKATAD
jgi:hypothetical protein